jgi:hypothetical protein
LDLDYLVGDSAMRLVVYCSTRLGARGFEETEDRTFVFVEPISQIVHAVFALSLEVYLVGRYDPLDSQTVNTFVDVHKK